jgi:hypothetical protein
LPEVKVTWKKKIPINIDDTLILETVDIDLKDYVKAEELKLKIKTVTSKILNTEHHVELNAVFYVDAQILGV